MHIFYRVMLLILCFSYGQNALAELRDPTRPQNAQGFTWMNGSQTAELQAIIISPYKRIAIFNGRALHVGDTVFGLKVVAIRPNTVHLAGPDGKMTLFLFNQTVKRLSDKRYR